jgi:hypothetical protein
MDTQRYVTHEGSRIPYVVVRSDRRTLAVTIARDGTVRVRAPRRISGAEVARLVAVKASWIARKRDELASHGPGLADTPLDAVQRAEAHRVLAERLASCWSRFARPGERMPELRVRPMRSRWGSMSASGGMSLNAYLLFASRECIDYVVFHELCHLRVRNHGQEFYREVATYVPEWRERRRALRALTI